MGTDELFKLKSDIEVELIYRMKSRKDYIEGTKLANQKLIDYANRLIQYIKDQKSIDINNASRKTELVFWRMIVYKHLRDRGLTLSDIGRIFHRDHATIIHNINNYQEFNRMKYDYFLIIKDKVELLISEYEFEVKN